MECVLIGLLLAGLLAWGLSITNGKKFDELNDRNSIRRSQRGLPEPPIVHMRVAKPNRRERSVMYMAFGSADHNPYAQGWNLMFSEREFIWGHEERALQIMAKQSKAAMALYLEWIVACGRIEVAKADALDQVPRWVRIFDELLPEYGLLVEFDETLDDGPPAPKEDEIIPGVSTPHLVEALKNIKKKNDVAREEPPSPPDRADKTTGTGTAPPRGLDEKFF